VSNHISDSPICDPSRSPCTICWEEYPSDNHAKYADMAPVVAVFGNLTKDMTVAEFMERYGYDYFDGTQRALLAMDGEGKPLMAFVRRADDSYEWSVLNHPSLFDEPDGKVPAWPYLARAELYRRECEGLPRPDWRCACPLLEKAIDDEPDPEPVPESSGGQAAPERAGGMRSGANGDASPAEDGDGMETPESDGAAVMTPSHPRWSDFKGMLATAVRVEDCDAASLRLSKRLLRNMDGIDVPKSLAHLKANGGYCDCEVLRNVDVCRRTTTGGPPTAKG
jgi:hypothetical protein